MYRELYFHMILAGKFIEKDTDFLKGSFSRTGIKIHPCVPSLLYFVLSRDGALLVLRPNIYFSILYSHEVLSDLEYVVKLDF